MAASVVNILMVPTRSISACNGTLCCIVMRIGRGVLRILHFSDLHIGVENYGRIDPQTGLSTRLIDFLSSLDQVVEFALTENVDLVILAGDAYNCLLYTSDAADE